MADFPLKPVGTEDVLRALDRIESKLRDVEGQQDSLGQSTGGAESAWGNLSQKLTAGVLIFQQVSGVIKNVATSLRAFGDDMETALGVVNRFTGDIDEAARRSGGLLTQMELMQAQNRLLATGLDVSAHQFANLTTKAIEMSAATGESATAALDRLVQGLQSGQTRALKQFGIELEGVTGRSEILEHAMAQLEETNGDVTSSADTLGGRMGVLENRMEDAKLEFFRSLDAVSGMTEAVDDLARAFEELGIGEIGGELGIIRTVAIAIGSAFTAAVHQVSRFVRGINALMDLDFGAAAEQFAGVGAFAAMTDFQDTLERNFNEALQNELQQGRLGGQITAPTETETGTGTGGRGGNAKEQAMAAQREIDAAVADAHKQALIAQREWEMQTEKEFRMLMDEQRRADEQAAADARFAAAQTEKQKREGLREEELSQIQREQEDLKALYQQIGGELFGLATDIGDALADENKSVLEAIKKRGVAFLTNFALQETVKGAGAIAASLNPLTPFAAPGFIAEATAHFKAAALAGVGGAVLSQVPTGGGGGGGGSAASGGDVARPERASSDPGASGGGPRNFTVVINSPLPEVDIGRMNDRFRHEFESRYGASA